jgi:AbrB family looped-hinge helix DNA binding protein
MRIGQRGRVTIPKAIRDRFGFEPGIEVEILAQDGVVQIAHSPGSRAARVREIFGSKRFPTTTDELMKLLRL